MEPTVEAELAGVRRSLAAVAAFENLPVDAKEELVAAARALERLEASWSRFLPYLTRDNAAIAQLLQEVSSLLPGDIGSEIDEALATQGPTPEPAVFDVAAANRRNQVLRDLLARSILASPRREDGTVTTFHMRAATALRESLENRPW